jgi:uncharacterized protein YuzE
MISTTYDPEADAAYVRFAPKDVGIADTREVEPGVILDFDGAGNVIGIEVLGVSTRTRANAAKPAA